MIFADWIIWFFVQWNILAIKTIKVITRSSAKRCSIRSSHLRCLVGKVVCKNFAKFKGKHLCSRVFFLIKSQNIKKRFWHRRLPVSFVKFLNTYFSTKHLLWLLLKLALRVRSNSFASLTIIFANSGWPE